MRWPKYLHRKTFLIVLTIDVVVSAVTMYMAYARVQSVEASIVGLIAFVLNLPALPLMLFFVIFPGPRTFGSDRVDLAMLVASQASIVLVSSWAWALVAGYRIRRRSQRSE